MTRRFMWSLGGLVLLLNLLVIAQGVFLSAYWKRLESQSTLVLVQTDEGVEPPTGQLCPVTIRLTNYPELSELYINDKRMEAERFSQDQRHATYGPFNVAEGGIIEIKVFAKGGVSARSSIRIDGEPWVGIEITDDWVNIQASSALIGFI